MLHLRQPIRAPPRHGHAAHSTCSVSRIPHSH